MRPWIRSWRPNCWFSEQISNSYFSLFEAKEGKFQSLSVSRLQLHLVLPNRVSLSACTGKANEGKLQFFGSILEGLALPTCAGFVCVCKNIKASWFMDIDSADIERIVGFSCRSYYLSRM